MFVVFNQIFSAVTAREMEVDRLANFDTFVAKLRFPLGRRDACQGLKAALSHKLINKEEPLLAVALAPADKVDNVSVPQLGHDFHLCLNSLNPCSDCC